MSQRVFLGQIHKVMAGPNPLDCMSFSVGQSIPKANPKFTVTEITIDEEMYERYGKISIIVWAKKIGQQESFAYKVFVDIPVTLSPDTE